jgi:formylglycine-generating enzyme required for sulfatase activity
MGDIFISYRRQDSAGWVLGLARDLRAVFPDSKVFHDIASIAIGEDFLEAIERSLQSCGVVLIVIGPQWLNIRDEDGNRRLDDPEDWVRLEVAASLAQPGLKVVPVRVGGAAMPKAATLPEPLRPLARRHAHEITDTRWDYDVGQLAEALRRILPTETKSGPDLLPQDDADGPQMVRIPAGSFLMGSPADEEGRFDNEGPQHRVTIARSFSLGRCAVTRGDFARFIEASGYRTEAEREPEEGIGAWIPDKNEWGWAPRRSWRDPGFPQDDRHPVVGVSWNDAQAYVQWLRETSGKPFRLPSEAEWEYAARAGTTTARYWGDAADQHRHANGADRRLKGKFPKWPYAIHEADDGYAETAPVGSFQPNAFGLYDMLGNVLEWVQDVWHDTYEGAPGDGRAWEGGNEQRRVLRGGSWSYEPRFLRSADRFGSSPDDRNGDIGFRLAQD